MNNCSSFFFLKWRVTNDELAAFFLTMTRTSEKVDEFLRTHKMRWRVRVTSCVFARPRQARHTFTRHHADPCFHLMDALIMSRPYKKQRVGWLPPKLDEELPQEMDEIMILTAETVDMIIYLLIIIFLMLNGQSRVSVKTGLLGYYSKPASMPSLALSTEGEWSRLT